jgi:hypothetical protein
MKRLTLALGLLTALACSGLDAQTTLVANVPFGFQLGKTFFPAGEYSIQASSHVLSVRPADGQTSTIMALTLPISRLRKAETGVLEFNRYGDTYFLAKIWSAGSEGGEALPKTAREKELARADVERQTVAIALHSK